PRGGATRAPDPLPLAGLRLLLPGVERHPHPLRRRPDEWRLPRLRHDGVRALRRRLVPLPRPGEPALPHRRLPHEHSPERIDEVEPQRPPRAQSKSELLSLRSLRSLRLNPRRPELTAER